MTTFSGLESAGTQNKFNQGRKDKMGGVDEEELKPMRISHAFDKESIKCCDSMIDRRRSAFVLLFLTVVVVVSLSMVSNSTVGRDVLVLQCPGEISRAQNDFDGFEEDYLTATAGKGNMVLSESNITDFLESFRTMGYDDWGYSYEKVKEGMYHWKSTMYPDNLNDGDMIFESACGIGLNLYMTLEILHEVKGLQSLVVYGNEYLAKSTEKANLLFDHAAPYGAKKGSICTADSAHLEFVPSNSFDLVFTGYITPVYDPLHFENDTVAYSFKRLRQICKDTGDWKSQKLKELTQEAQGHYYASWVSEMIRIAKPGKPIIVEQVSQPYCNEHHDWGGVPKEWWKPAIKQYGWDVDPESIVVENDTLFSRYHVFLRKNL